MHTRSLVKSAANVTNRPRGGASGCHNCIRTQRGLHLADHGRLKFQVAAAAKLYVFWEEIYLHRQHAFMAFHVLGQIHVSSIERHSVIQIAYWHMFCLSLWCANDRWILETIMGSASLRSWTKRNFPKMFHGWGLSVVGFFKGIKRCSNGKLPV